MGFISAAKTDKGNYKTSNQDSLVLNVAQTTKAGMVLMAIVCDGMGGLAKGELASATVVRAFNDWFMQTLPQLIESDKVNAETVRNEWVKIIGTVSNKIAGYGKMNNLSLGTTLVGALCVGSNMYIVNVGDSRLYKVSRKLERLTTDHSLVAREIAAGRLRPEDEEKDPRRNVLLQCIGASKEIRPEFKVMPYTRGDTFVLCSDGFRHEIKEEEVVNYLASVTNDSQLEQQLAKMIEIDMSRNEADNITAVSFKVV
ncbi:MAG: serine/threonine-protein phosphatase [Clostridia bacterium]|nr:serine/threonine-protein phosphatase [Clostridia bacterium]